MKDMRNLDFNLTKDSALPDPKLTMHLSVSTHMRGLDAAFFKRIQILITDVNECAAVVSTHVSVM